MCSGEHSMESMSRPRRSSSAGLRSAREGQRSDNSTSDPSSAARAGRPCPCDVGLTHVGWHDGALSDDDWLPFFSCAAVGAVLLEAADAHPTKQIEVYCGHTHSPGLTALRPNLVVHTGGARYGLTLAILLRAGTPRSVAPVHDLPSVAAMMVGCAAVLAACASGEEPGNSFGGGVGAGGGSADGGAGGGTSSSSGSTNTQSGPGPGTVTTSTTTTSTTTTSDTSTSSTSEPPCQDQGPGEPANDTMAGAYDLGEITDSDDDASQVTGNLRAVDDVDWYFFHGTDEFFSSVDPSSQVVGEGLRACMFIQCEGGDPEFDCPSDTVAANEGGLPGCCWNGEQEVKFGLNCTGSVDDDAKVFAKVEDPDGPGCVSYTLNYHY